MLIHFIDSLTKRHQSFHRPGEKPSQENVVAALRTYYNIESAPSITLEASYWHDHAGENLAPFSCFSIEMTKGEAAMCLNGMVFP